MTVAEPSGAAWEELRAALKEFWIHPTRLDRVWEARIAEGQPVVRVLLKDSWWELRLKGSWCGGQRAAYEKIASGAAPGELFFCGVPVDNTQLGNCSDRDPHPDSIIKCRLVAWLPREQIAVAKTPPDAPPVRANETDLRHLDEEIDIRDLREAIRANQVTFPSQVPTFTKHDRPELERKLAQLYYVLGWDCTNIGARYGLSPERVGQILNTWKRRAVRAGYIQQIPPAEVMNEGARARASLHTIATRAPDPVHQFVHTSSVIRSLQMASAGRDEALISCVCARSAG
jgi:hypothetical protein